MHRHTAGDQNVLVKHKASGIRNSILPAQVLLDYLRV
jgi:hypothetical protein